MICIGKVECRVLGGGQGEKEGEEEEMSTKDGRAERKEGVGESKGEIGDKEIAEKEDVTDEEDMKLEKEEAYDYLQRISEVVLPLRYLMLSGLLEEPNIRLCKGQADIR